MSLDDYPIDEDYIDPPSEPAYDAVSEDPRDPEEIDKTHTFLSGNSGANSDRIMDSEAIIENDGRSDTVTGFDSRESNDPWRWERLSKMNDGMWDRNENPDRAQAVQQRTAETFCNALEMTTYQTERVVWIIKRLDMNMFGHYSYEDVTLAVISVVANEDSRWIRDEEMYKRLCEVNEMGPKQIRRIRKRLREDKRWKDGGCPL